MADTTRSVRQERLRETVNMEPFLTDEELATRFAVSVQTIRLDRMALGIPEVRERLRAVATAQFDAVRTLSPNEVFGDVTVLELGHIGVSVWKAYEEHVIGKSGIVRGHHLFAQANSLAVAIVDAEQALTAKSTIRFLRPVRLLDAVVARARVMGTRHGYVLVEVVSRVEGVDVFSGTFLIQRSTVSN